MRTAAVFLLAGTLSLFGAAGCETESNSSNRSGDEGTKIAAKSTIEGSVEMWYEREKCSRNSKEPLYHAEEIWSNAHCEQIMETLKITRVDSVDGLIAAFTAYLVDGNNHNKVVKLRRVEHPEYGSVYGISYQAFSLYGERLDGEKEKLVEDIDRWESLSSDWHK